MDTVLKAIAYTLACLVAAVVCILVLVPVFALGILDAVVIADTWRWFAVPLLGLKPISVGAAFGLNLLVWAFIRRPAEVGKKPESKTPIKDGAKTYGSLLLAILVGWGVAYLTARFWTHTL